MFHYAALGSCNGGRCFNGIWEALGWSAVRIYSYELLNLIMLKILFSVQQAVDMGLIQGLSSALALSH